MKKMAMMAGVLAFMLFSPAPKNTPIPNFTGAIEAQAAELTQSARWVGSGDRWQVSDNAGGFIKNCWFQDDVTGHWYLLGAEDGSVMYAGLVTDQSTGKTYLLNTNHDGTFGRMLTVDGTYNINGKSVYLKFNQNHDGTFGAITSGLSDARSTGVQESVRDRIATDNGGQAGSQVSNGSENNGQVSSTYDPESKTYTYITESGGILRVGDSSGGAYRTISDEQLARIAEGFSVAH